jgi:uncharacterized protein YodC (DUF2158 family)
MDYVVGDIVYLKSGSPALIVSSIKTFNPGHSQVTVVWINEEKQGCSMTADGRCFSKSLRKS